MRQWKSLVALHASAPSCFPHPPSPSPRHSVSDSDSDSDLAAYGAEAERPSPKKKKQEALVVRLVGCDGRVRAYSPPVTARELMQAHPRHLVCRADALLIGERIPAVAPGEELTPGQAYFLLPAHLFRSVLSFVSLASSLLLLLSSTTAGTSKGGACGGRRPFELQRTASGTLRIKFSDDFLVGKEEEEGGRGRRAPRCCAGTSAWRRSTRSWSGTASPAAGRPSWSPSRRWSSPPMRLRRLHHLPPPPPHPIRGARAGASRSSAASAAGAGATPPRPAAGPARWRAPGSY